MSNLELPDGVKLYCHSWPAEGECKATLLVVHGLGEHCGRYEALAKALNAQGITVESFDLRGHGNSGGRRGHLGNVQQALKDLKFWIEQVKTEKPCFLLGHSLGGYLVVRLMLQEKLPLSGVILTSPCLALSKPPPAWQVFIGLIAVRILPSFLTHNQLDLSMLTRDAAELNIYQEDPLNHNRVSLATAEFLVDGLDLNFDPKSWPQVPTLIVHGDADGIASPAATKRFSDHIGVPANLLPGVYHEPLHEIPEVQAEVIQTFSDFILGNC